MNKLNKKSEAYVVQYNEKVLVIHYDCNRRKYWDREDVRVFTDNFGDLHTLMAESSVLPRRKIETIIIDSLLVNYKLISCYNLFSCFTNLRRIIGLEYLNTSEVNDMKYMFRGCKRLISLDLRGFDTSKVISMYSMFADCSSLIELDLSNFSTSNVVAMSDMFSYCESLNNLDLRNFDTSNVLDMASMFHSCICLTEVNLSGFKTSNETNMCYMFAKCNNLKTIHTGDGWNISKYSEGIFC